MAESTIKLPEGFVLDEPISVPEGFVLDNAPQQRNYPLSSVPLAAVKNYPSDLWNVLKEIGTGVKDIATSPVETGIGLANMLSGAITNVASGIGAPVPEERMKEEDVLTANAVGDSYKNKYGGYENIKRTIAERPASTMMDISSLLTGVGALARTSGLAKTANVLSKTGSAVEPITATTSIFTKALPYASGKVSKLVNSVEGAISGKGAASYEQIGNPGFFKSLWGKTTGEELVRKAESGLVKSIKAGKSEYKAGLQNLKLIESDMNFAPITSKATEMLDSFEVNYNHAGFNRLINNSYKGKDISKLRGMDIDAVFGMSTLDEAAIPDVLKALRTIKKWGESSDYLTPRGFDILKRKLGNMGSESNNGRAFISALRNATRDTLVDQVPQYGKMMKRYGDMMDMQEDMSMALGLRDPMQKRANVDMILRKFMSTMREDNEFRRGLLNQISTGEAKNLPAEIAGYNLRPGFPGGLFGKNLEAGFIFGSILGKNPVLLLGMAAASPKVSATVISGVKEMAKAAGKLKGPIEYQQKFSPAFKQVPFQINNLNQGRK